MVSLPPRPRRGPTSLSFTFPCLFPSLRTFRISFIILYATIITSTVTVSTAHDEPLAITSQVIASTEDD